MSKTIFSLPLIILSLCLGGAVAEEAGTKGQNFDRIVFESPVDGEVRVTARVMTINRFQDSASEITVVNNGADVLGPETNSAERWTRTVAIKGVGRHEVVLLCRALNASPVYCGLTLDDPRARVVE